jgi:hypothetical protein
MFKRSGSRIRTTPIVTAAIFATVVLAPLSQTPPASAQVPATAVASGTVGIRSLPATSGAGMPGMGRSNTGLAGGLGRPNRGHSSPRSAILLPYPYYASDYGYASEGAAQPQSLGVPAAAPLQPAPPAPPLEPLLIEWQGDHFERMTPLQRASSKERSEPDSSASASALSGSPRPSRKPAAQPAHASAREPVPELPPAVLVFRDGRTEEVSNYTIMSGTIYSKADYWTTGSWIRKIEIADLDVPATLKLNHDHGLNFRLPASPNEVVTRP